MRRSMVRDISLLFPTTILLILGFLVGFEWHSGGAIQRMRDASAASAAETKLLGSLAEELQVVRTRIAALRENDIFDAAQSQSVASADAHVLDRVTRAAKAIEASHRRDLHVVKGGIRMLRWIAVLVAGLGALGVLGVVRQLRRAWRRLARAELQQRLLAQRLRGSLDSLSQGVAVFSVDGLLLNWNTRLQQMLELPALLLQSGLPYDALEHHLASAADGFLEPLATIQADCADVASGAPVVYERASSRGGADTQIEIRRTLMPQGGFVLTLTDMTERVHAEQMLREAQKMQAMGQLTGGIAHDFNNMLTVILASLDVSEAERVAAGDQQNTLLTTRMNAALRAAETGAALTRRLLDFAHKQPVAPVPVDMSSVLANLMPLLRHTIGDAIALSFRSEAGLWASVIDTAQLESAVLNLALNARDAMPQGGTLAIEAINLASESRGTWPRELAPGDYVRLSIADSGAGMSREVLARAFEPFFTTKPEGSGTGLGLAMVFAFARQSGGHAMIQSEVERGCTILIYLPRAAPGAGSSAMSAPPALPQPSSDAARDTTPQPRIMVVEDDASIRQIAAGVLRELGYRVSEAHDAEEAMRQLDGHAEALDLLLTDLTLPGIDGHALAAHVQAELARDPGALYDRPSTGAHRTRCFSRVGDRVGDTLAWQTVPTPSARGRRRCPGRPTAGDSGRLRPSAAGSAACPARLLAGYAWSL